MDARQTSQTRTFVKLNLASVSSNVVFRCHQSCHEVTSIVRGCLVIIIIVFINAELESSLSAHNPLAAASFILSSANVLWPLSSVVRQCMYMYTKVTQQVYNVKHKQVYMLHYPPLIKRNL